jgi:transposase
MLTPEQRQQRNADMVRAAHDGATYSELAKLYGLSLNWAGRVIRRNGGPIPPHGKGVKRDVNYSQCREEYEAGKKIRTLADNAGVSYGAMRRGLLKAGAVFRARGGASRT